ncbi:MAG: hypothetical protein FJX46_05125 [Alphaproteobacteria bacterium]|nr:hypothetical protein [Alphaproteobacteria bacterium]
MPFSRVSTLSTHTTLLSGLLNNQNDVFIRQQQVTTGLKAPDFAGIARDVAPLTSAKANAASIEHYQRNINELDRRLKLYATTLDQMRDIQMELRTAVMNARGSRDGSGLAATVDRLYEAYAGLLNTQDNGRYIFGGTKSTTAPISQVTASGFQALATSGGVFANDTNALKMQVDDTLNIDFGINASSFATDTMDLFHQLMNYDGGTVPAGPPAPPAAASPAAAFGTPLADNQIAFLDHILTNVRSLNIFDDTDQKITNNGLNQRRITETMNRHEARLVTMRSFIGNIQDVDAAEAVSRLNLDQVSLQASMQVMARVGQLSLLQFI